MWSLVSAVASYAGAWLLGLAALAVVDDYVVARVGAPIALSTAFFFAEHLRGLGELPYAGPALALALGAIVWRRRERVRAALRQAWDVEAACAAGTLWALSWRWQFPDINAVSEKMTSLLMVASFGAGEKLPPIDPWLPPERLTVYYPLQHYAAGLARRLLHLEPALAINLCFCLGVGLLAAAAWACVAARVRGRLARAACVCSLALGGTGAALAVPLMTRATTWPTAVVRFLGEWGASPEQPTPLGRRLAQGPEAPHLPVEPAAYYVGLGDYHPPLGGWILLALGLYAARLACKDEGQERARLRWAGVALATVPLSLPANAWVAPLQGLLIAAALAPLARRPSRALEPEVWGPPLLACALLVPFLAGFFGPATAGNHLRLVARADRPALSAWLLVFWPLLALLGAAAAAPSPESRRRALLWAGLLAFAELIFVDDLYSHPYNRFNTYLKWMPWLFVGMTVDLAPAALAEGGKAARAAALIALLAPCVFAASLGRQKACWDAPNPGRLDGLAWLTDDEPKRAVLEELRTLPGGLTLEYPPAMSYTSASAVSLLSGHATYIGWPNHEVTWRGQRDDIWKRYNEARSWYGAEMSDPAGWLRERGINHVVWLPEDAEAERKFQALDALLEPDYAWREAYRSPTMRAGVWTRR